MKSMSAEKQKMPKMCMNTHFAGRLASMLYDYFNLNLK